MNDKNSGPVVIAGGSGFLGVSLAFHLARTVVRGSPDPALASTEGLQPHQPIIILSRKAPKIPGPWRHVPWDARTIGNWHRELDGAAALVNLVGRSVDCIKTPDHQDEILRSRVEATRVLGQAMRLLDSPPPVWVQMSTAHIYGDPPALVCSEDSPFGTGLAPFVGRAWEQAFHESMLPSQRQVILRPSFVIGRDRGAGGGAIARLRTLVRLGLGGRVGTGRQGMSWIHELDMNRLFERAIGPVAGGSPESIVVRGSPDAPAVRGSPDPALPPTEGLPPSSTSPMTGAYIATAPNPVSQIEFMRELRRAMHMPIGLPAFAWMVRLGAPLLLRTDPDLALYGRYLISTRLREEGFEFRYPVLSDGMAELFAA